MDTTISESEADSLFTQSRAAGLCAELPATRDRFRLFVTLMSGVEQPPGRALLVCRRRTGAEPEVFLLGDSFTMGKRKDCDLSTPESAVISRLHFTIIRTSDGNYLLTDQSINGTFFYPGTRRLPPGEPYLLRDGDILWVEGIVIAFKAQLSPAGLD